jgi:hypothetical protein
MDWHTANDEQINHKISEAIRLGRGVTVSPTWLEIMVYQARQYGKMHAGSIPQNAVYGKGCAPTTNKEVADD